MIKRSIQFFFFVALVSVFNTAAQSKMLDSLRSRLEVTTVDSERVKLRFDIGQYAFVFRISYWDSLRIDCEQLAKKAGPKNSFIFSAYTADVLNNIGFIYYNKADIEKALSYFSQGLKIQEQIGNIQGASTTLNNMAFIFSNQGDNEKALETFLKSLKFREEIGDKSKIATTLMNIGLIYRKQGDNEKALKNFERSLQMQEDAGERLGIATCLYNIGSVYSRRGEDARALDYFNRSLLISRDIGDREGEAFSLNDIATISIRQKNFSNARTYSSASLQIGQDLGYPELIKYAAGNLSTVYKATGDYKKALEYYELFVQMRDSLVNEDNKKASVKTQLKYEYDKKMATDSVERAKESEIRKAQISKQASEIKAKKNQQYALFGGLIIVIVFAAVMFSRFRITQRQKKIIELQKNLVEEKQKEILDSIYYARRIQRALITNEKYIARNLNRLQKK